MTEYLPPVSTKLVGDLRDFAKMVAEAKALVRSLGREVKDLNRDGVIRIKVNKSDFASAQKAAASLSDSERKVAYDADKAAAEIRRIGLTSAESFIAANAALDHYRDNLAKLNRDLNQDAERNASWLKRLLGGIPWGKKVGLPGPLPSIPIWSIGPAILIAAAAVGSLAAEVGAVIAGFTAATAGVGAFALFAVPAIQKVYAALTAGSSKGLHGQLLGIYNTIQNIIGKYQSLAATFGRRWTPVALQLLSRFAQDALTILPQLMPLANAAAKALFSLGNSLADALGGVLGRKGHLAHLGGHGLTELFSSSAFQNAIKILSQYAGPALVAIGKGIARVIAELGRFVAAWFRLMSVKDVVNGLNIAFGVLAWTIHWLTNTLVFLAWSAMNTWDVFSKGVKLVRNWLHDINHAIDAFVSMAIGAFEKLGHNTARVFSEVRHTIASAYDRVRHDTAAWVNGILHIAQAGWSWLIGSIIKTGHSIESNWNHAWTVVINYVKGVPGMIIHALGNLGSLLISAGAAVINGFWQGMKDVWSHVLGWLSSLGGLIGLHKGPIDYDRTLLVPHGHAIMQGLMDGMRAELPALRYLLEQITREIPGGLMSQPSSGAYPGGPMQRPSRPRWHWPYPVYGGYGPMQTAGNGPMVVESHVYLDGREIFTSVQQQAVRRQKRSGNNGLQRLVR